jgi:hypothetical protein
LGWCAGQLCDRWMLRAGNSSSNSSINCNQPEVSRVAHPVMGTRSVPAILCSLPNVASVAVISIRGSLSLYSTCRVSSQLGVMGTWGTLW